MLTIYTNAISYVHMTTFGERCVHFMHITNNNNLHIALDCTAKMRVPQYFVSKIFLDVTGCYVSARLWGARNVNVYSRVSAVGAHCSSTRLAPQVMCMHLSCCYHAQLPTSQPIRTRASHAHTQATNQDDRVIELSNHSVTCKSVFMPRLPPWPIWLTNAAILTILVPN